MSIGLSRLTIDLDAIAQNWSSIAELVAPAECSAVVKANAYGLGVVEVSRRLYAEGCRIYFVASLEEGRELKSCLPGSADIYLLSGLALGEERRCLDLGLIPVLISLAMLRRWLAVAAGRDVRSALKIDTGMHRLGLSEEDLSAVFSEPDLLSRAGIEMVISHLACADEPEHPANKAQLTRFQHYKKQFLAVRPTLKFSLANSAGCLLGPEYHFDMVRPGVALYGSRPHDFTKIEIRAVVSLVLQVRQLRRLQKGESIGYGASFTAAKTCLVAVAAGGYADGLFRSLAASASACFDGKRLPMLGRVSMDSVSFDVSATNLLIESNVDELSVELIGEHQSIDEYAASAGTIAYEALTALGTRFSRVYLGSAKSNALDVDNGGLF